MSLLLALTGGGAVNYTLTGSAGSYTVAGQPAVLSVAKKLAGTAGSYAVSGQAASFSVNRKLAGAAGSYSYSGQAASFLRMAKLTGANGAYSYTGQAATLTYTPGAGAVSYTLTGSSGGYSITGNTATLSVVILPKNSGGFEDYGENIRQQAKRTKLRDEHREIVTETQQVIAQIKADDDCFAEAADVSRKLQSAIADLNAAADKSQADAMAAQLQAEYLQQQAEELDVAYMMVVMAAHL